MFHYGEETEIKSAFSCHYSFLFVSRELSFFFPQHVQVVMYRTRAISATSLLV